MTVTTKPLPADLDDFEAYIARQTRGREGDERADLEAYLRTYPGRSVADWKGKALTAPVDALPWERPWHKLNRAEVRDAATRSLARDLPLNIRKAAGRDPGLIWNDYARKYRARLATDPAHEVGGGHESYKLAPLRTGAGPRCIIKGANPPRILRS